MTESRYEKAVETLKGTFGDRLMRDPSSGGATVSPKSVEEIRLVSEVAARHSAPLLPLGAGTTEDARPDGTVFVRFDLMRGLRLPQDDGPWVEAGPGTPWLELDDELRTRGRGLAVYPTSAPRATVGGWLAMDGLGVGSFEYGRLHENVLSATIVLPGGEPREVPPASLDALSHPEAGGGIVAGAKLRTRKADSDVPFVATLGDAARLSAAVEGLAASSPPFWHLGFISPVLARARSVGDGYMLFGAYPREREEGVDGILRATVESLGGRVLGPARAYRVWGERFYPVTPSAASVPDVRREIVPISDFNGALSGMEDGRRVALQGSVGRGGEASLLVFEENAR